MDMDISFYSIGAAPVYVPAFVFRSTHFGNKLRTFVSGFLLSSDLAIVQHFHALSHGASASVRAHVPLDFCKAMPVYY